MPLFMARPVIAKFDVTLISVAIPVLALEPPPSNSGGV